MNQPRTFNVRGAVSSPNCESCPCAKKGQPFRAVRSFGSPGGLCVVGEGPGTNEVLQGYPFVSNGESGKVLNKGLKLANVDRGYVWIVNAMLCKRPGTDEDMNIAVDCCRARLQQDLEFGKPTAIIALGGTAMRALQLPVTYVAQARGTVQYSPLLPSVPVVGSIHPAAILRGGAGELTKGGKQKMNVDAQAMFLFSDIGKASKIADGVVPPQWSDDITVVHEPSEVKAAMEAILADIYEVGILGLDLEWVCEGSKNPLDALGAGAHRALITWVGIGCTKRSVSFKWEALMIGYGLELLQTAMVDPSLPKLMHNKQADMAVWEAQVGPIAGRCLDSMLMHHAACPGTDHDLQQVASQFLCVPPWKVDHARSIAEHKTQMRVEAKVEKEAERERKRAERKAAHDARNAELHAEKLARQAEKKAAHEARLTKARVDKETRQAERQLKLMGVE